MEYRNFTRFSSMAFYAIATDAKEYHVVVMRGAFVAGAGGSLEMADEQQPLVTSDTYRGDPATSVLRQESDLAPYKPKTDVLVEGAGYAPGGKPVGRFTTSLKITRPGRDGGVVCEKQLLITGERWWKPGLIRSWRLTEPEPVARVPIGYDLAFGGTVTIEEPGKKTKHFHCPHNPVGRGYWPKEAIGASYRHRTLPAPQILAPNEPSHPFGRGGQPQGYGPIGKTWQPRLPLAGTYDEHWKEKIWPNLPPDFDFAYWNCAHPDLQVPFLQGDESIHLTNLTPSGSLTLHLPGVLPFVLVRYQHGVLAPAPAHLDTVFIEPDAGRVSLVWRATILSEPPVRVLEARMMTREEKEQKLKEARHG
jgi:hypothetical protein